MAGYIPRWHTRPKTVTRPSTNRARRGLTLFMRRTPLTTTCTPRRQMSYCNPVSGRAACGGVFVCLPGSISPELNIQSLPVTLRMLRVAVARSPRRRCNWPVCYACGRSYGSVLVWSTRLLLPTLRQPGSISLVSDEPFPGRSRPMSCQLTQMGSRPITFL